MGESGALKRVSFAPSKKHGWSEMSRFSCASSETMLSAASQFRPVLPWTRIFSVASHSTPLVKPKPPLGLVSAQRRLRSSDHARPGEVAGDAGRGTDGVVVLSLAT